MVGCRGARAAGCSGWVHSRLCVALPCLTPLPTHRSSLLWLASGCVVLLTVANLIKKVSIKLMSTNFHKEAHFNRMQEALRKVGGLLESHGWVV